MTIEDGIILNDVSKRIKDVQVLKNISVYIPSSEITAFIGPNGAGKSTLFHVISGALKPDHGTVMFKDKNITGLSTYAIARLGIGIQFQRVRVFNRLTVFENLLVSKLSKNSPNIWKAMLSPAKKGDYRKRYKADIEYWLNYVGLHEQRQKLAEELSLGHQKLLALACLFSKDFKFLLLDEPTASLSFQMIQRVTSIIQMAIQDFGFTVAMIEHDMDVVTDLASSIHFLHEGEITHSGKTEDIINNERVRKIYMGV